MGFLSIQSIIPPGVTLPYSGTSIPSGWLLCDGSAVSRTVYSALYAAFGTTYGSGDAATTFNLPDLRGRTIIGIDVPVSNIYADRVTSAGTTTAQINSKNLGAAGGSQTHQLSSAQMPPHNHDVANYGLIGTVRGAGYWDTYNDGATNLSQATDGRVATSNFSGNSRAFPIGMATAGGSGGVTQAHQNTQPSIVLNYIVKI